MIIRKAKITEIDQIMNMYSSCVNGMLKLNIDQWDSTYPNEKIISQDLNNGTYFIVVVPLDNVNPLKEIIS